MKIQDEYIFLEDDELIKEYWFLDKKRSMPDYIEKGILRVFFEKNKLNYNNCVTIKDYLNNIPKDIVRKVIVDSAMFDSNKKANYDNKELSYLFYYLPQNIYKIWRPLIDLHIRDLLKNHLKVLDIGTGPATIPLGVLEYYKIIAEIFPQNEFSISFTLIDSNSQFLDIAKNLLNSIKEKFPSNINITLDKAICKSIDNDNTWIKDLGEFDLITMSNFIHPNEDKGNCNLITLFEGFKNNNMHKKASIVVIEPSDDKNCSVFKEFRNEIINRKILKLFSPCLPVWNTPHAYNCKCYNNVFAYWNRPNILNFLIKNGLTKRAKKDYIPYNYAIFRNDDRKKYSPENNKTGYVSLKEIYENSFKRVNVKAIVRLVLRDYKIFDVCDGTIDCSKVRFKVRYNSSKLKDKILVNVGEKVILKEVMVTKMNEKEIYLDLDENSKIQVFY